MNKNRKTEIWIYGVLWVIVVGFYMLDRISVASQAGKPLWNLNMGISLLKTFTPFVILFLINNHVLIPKFLLRNKFKSYFVAAVMAVLLLWIYQFFEFRHFVSSMPPHPGMNSRVRPLLPFPLLLDFTYAILIVGVNIAVALMFRQYDDKLERERLLKTNAENQLAYLKAQINPHFYMNMLNNIHGMIEVNPTKAQSMVIEMSQLMRYMLYDSSQPLISLASEIAFLENYLHIMRHRYPEDKLNITSKFPSEQAMSGLSIPPLLYLVFIENAFKHGVSYKEHSFVDISVELQRGMILFKCTNSRHTCNRETDPGSHGIGLENIRKRLLLIYGEAAHLNITAGDNFYDVTLTIPNHEIKNIDNR